MKLERDLNPRGAHGNTLVTRSSLDSDEDQGAKVPGVVCGRRGCARCGLKLLPRVEVTDVLGAALIDVFQVIGDDVGHAPGIEDEVPLEGLHLEVPPGG